MPFIPLDTPRKATDPTFPWVSPDEQADRDAEAARLVADELANSDDPEQRAILTKEYRLRFGAEPPTPPRPAAPRGFIPLGDTGEVAPPAAKRGFIPLAPQESPDSQRPSVLKTIALNNPLTAIAETGLNLATQGVALPVAGLAGLATEAVRALGMTEKTGADVVHSVGEKLTYQPRGDLGKATTGAVMVPFEKLAEVGQAAGDKTLEATGSPAVATAVDTAINALPMAISPAAKGVRAAKERVASKVPPEAPAVVTPEAPRGFIPLEAEQGKPVAETVRLAEAPQEATNAKPGIHDPIRTPETIPEIEGGISLNELPGQIRQVTPELSPEQAIRLNQIDTRLATIEADRPNRTPAVRASLEREAARLESERSGLLQDTKVLQRGDGEAATLEPLATMPKVVEEFAGLEAVGRQSAEALAAAGIDHRTISPAAADALDFLHENRGSPERVQAFQEAIQRSMEEDGGAVQAQIGEPKTLNMAGVQNSFAPGNEYVGFINDAPGLGAGTATPASAAGRGKPIRREDILVDFAKSLGASIYEGRVKGKNRLGFFRPGLEETRIKRHADLETAAHELAHLIDDRVPAIANAWRSDKALREQLRSISYDQAKVNEGFAEGVRLWMTQPEALQAKAPLVFNWLEKFSDTHKYGPAMRKAQAGMTEWFGQDAIDRARSKIGDHRPLSDALDGMWDRFRQSTVDDLHGIYRMERELKGGKVAPVGAYESARLSRASASIADGAIRYGYPTKQADGSFKYQGRGLEEILKPVAENLDDALLYFVGRSSRELLAQGREHLFTPGEIDAMLRLRTPEREAAFKAYQEWNKGILDFAEAQGVINPETRKLWKRAEYLPFHRVASPEGGLKGKPGDWQGIRALTGGTENIRDVLGNMVGNAAMLIDKAVKNEARLKVAELAQQPGGGKFMAKINPETRPVKVSGDQVLKEMFERYGIAMDGDAPAFFEFLVHGQPPGGGNVVAVLQGGKPVWYQLADPILYRALQAIDRPKQNWLVKWLGMPKRVGQASITLDPTFIARNLSRDQITAGVMTQAGFRPMIDAMSGLRSRIAEDPIYRDWIANGGGLSSLFLDDAALRKNLDRFYANHGIDVKTVLDTPEKMLYFVERAGDAIESMSRIGEFTRAIERGEHPRHAAYLSREVSVDWATKGDSKALSVAYDTVMFLRAAVVSLDRVYRGVAHDPNRGAIAAKTGAIALASTLLYLMNRGDPRYDDMEDWKKDAFWHVWIGDEHFKLPKAFEIGAVASIAERTTEKILEGDPAGLGKDYIRIIGNVFGLNWKPQFAAPLMDQATNKQGLTRTPIETPGMENLQPAFRAKPHTSETMKKMGELTGDWPEEIQFNPVRAEALLRGYLNAWGGYALMATDALVSDGKAPEMRADQLPVAKAFYENDPPLRTKFENQFYELLAESKRLRGTLRHLDETGRSDWADRKEQSPLAGEAKPLERAAKSLSAINGEMRQVRRDDVLSPAEKRQKLDALTVERNALLKAAVMDAKAAQKEKQ